MAEHEMVRGDPQEEPCLADLREVNQGLLIAGLREQEFAAAILAGIDDAVLVVDRTGKIVRVNAAYARLAGGDDGILAPEDERGRRLPPDQTPWARAARGEKFTLEFGLTASDGSLRWFEAKGRPLGDVGAGSAVVVIRDITMSNRHRRLQDDFIALAAHELRTPLTAVQGSLELLGRWTQDTADARVPRTIATALRQARRLRMLVNDLTDVGRLRSERLAITWDVVDLAALTTETVEIAKGLAEQHPITLDAPVEPLFVRGDANRLEQVLLNLLTNAVTHTPPTTCIKVRLLREDACATLAVHDAGPGIAADVLPHLFERFYQVARLDRGSQGGLGLGLYISHQLIEAHDGKIAVASAPGEGTTFTIRLPLQG
jgi:two-component system, chemotaxis family, CheB/CheR fusion protein